MAVARPWVRAELPWLRSGPLHRVHSDAVPELERFLTRFPYRRVDLQGQVMTSRDAAHAELARAFEFPSYYGRNWDAYDDSMGEFIEAHVGELIAVVWHDVDHAGQAAPATTAEVGWALLDLEYGQSRARVSMDIFVTGDGADFDQP